MAKSNGKTQTHFEQIPLAIVPARIADDPDDRDGQRRLSDFPNEAGETYQIRSVTDRRKSPTVPPPARAKES